MKQEQEGMRVKKDMALEPVAAVCGNEVRFYGPMEWTQKYPKGIRPLRSLRRYGNHGQALQAAWEYEQ